MARNKARTPPPVAPQQNMQQAIAAYQRGDMPAARKALAPLIEHLPPEGDVFILAGLVELQQQRPGEAERLLARGVELAPARIEGWLGLGNARQIRGDARGAIQAFEAALQRQPDSLEARNNLGIALETMGRVERALEQFERVHAARPDFPGIDLSRARAYSRLGDAERARALYEGLVAARPDDAALGIEFAGFLERCNEPDAAAARLDAVADIDGAARRTDYAAVRARLQARAGDHAAAMATLAAARERGEDAGLAYQAGNLHDRAGEVEQAVGAFDAANRARGGQWTFRRLRRQQFAEFVADKARRGLDFAAAEPAAIDAGEPIFLIGLPRSGTTLVDRMLAAHPRVQLLEEFEGLRLAEDALAAGESADTARAAWREHIAARTNIRDDARLVDKNPLHAAHLDTLARLFPRAPVIVVRRHPWDAALSCWMQDFAPNPATVHFLERESTARLCGNLLALMQQFEAARAGQVVALRYESLVGDFTGEIARVLEAVGLDWDDAVADYAGRTDRGGMITTPSYAQVTRGLYTSAIDRWRRYAPWLDGFAEHLGPAARAWGYDTE